MIKFIHLSAFLIAWTILPTARAGVQVLSPNEVANTTFHAPEWVCTGPTQTKVTGRLLCLHHLALSLNKTLEEIRSIYSPGAILMVSTTHLLEADYPPFFYRGGDENLLLDIISILKPSGIFLYNTAARVGSTAEILLVDRTFCHRIGIPILETGLDESQNILRICETYSNTTEITVELTTGDPNLWMQIKRGGYLIVFRVVATLMAATAGIISAAKLIGYVRQDGLSLSIPIVSLSVQLIAALFRIGIVSIDPIYAGLSIGATAAHMTTTISFPLNFISMILLTMYWSEILDASKIRISSLRFLTRLRIPFILACIILYVAEITATLGRAIRFGIRIPVASTISGVLYIVFTLAASIVFFVYGGRVIHRLIKTSSLTNIKGSYTETSSRTNASLRRLTLMLVVTGFFNLIFIAAFVIAVFESFFYTPIGFHLSWTLMYLGILGGSISQVSAVKWPAPISGRNTISDVARGQKTSTSYASHTKSTEPSDIETSSSVDSDES